MAPSATQRPSRSPKRPRTTAKKAAAAPAKKTVAAGAKKMVKTAVRPKRGSISSIGMAAARKGVKLIAKRAVEAGARAIQSATDRSAVGGKGAVEAALSRRLPIQVSIDVAVPVAVAWEEWMSWGMLTEGVHRIEDVERDGSTLFGHTAGPGATDWEAEIRDERPEESFAWRSVAGTDCAGLVTFHELSERLTRIELDLDVLPRRPGEALSLSLHLARRRAEADLRRFKAHVEFINPDVYERRSSGAGSKRNRSNGGGSKRNRSNGGGSKRNTSKANGSNTKRKATKR